MFENISFFKFRSKSGFKRAPLDKQVSLFFGVFFALSFFLILQSRGGYDFLSSFGVRISSVLMESIYYPARFIESAVDSLKTYSSLRGEVENLKNELSLLKNAQEDRFVEADDYAKVKKILDSLIPINTNPCVARVLGPENMFPRSFLYIHVPENYSTKKDQLVLTEKGLVGRISDISGRRVKVLLLSDYCSRVPVRIKDTGEQAIVYGQGSDDELRVVFVDQPVFSLGGLEGRLLTTSGVDDVFSPNIPVAKIVRVKDGEVFAKPLNDFRTIEFVSIQ